MTICQKGLCLVGSHVCTVVVSASNLVGDKVEGALDAVSIQDAAGVGVLVCPAIIKSYADHRLGKAVASARVGRCGAAGNELGVINLQIACRAQYLVKHHGSDTCRDSERSTDLIPSARACDGCSDTDIAAGNNCASRVVHFNVKSSSCI